MEESKKKRHSLYARSCMNSSIVENWLFGQHCSENRKIGSEQRVKLRESQGDDSGHSSMATG